MKFSPSKSSLRYELPGEKNNMEALLQEASSPPRLAYPLSPRHNVSHTGDNMLTLNSYVGDVEGYLDLTEEERNLDGQDVIKKPRYVVDVHSGDGDDLNVDLRLLEQDKLSKNNELKIAVGEQKYRHVKHQEVEEKTGFLVTSMMKLALVNDQSQRRLIEQKANSIMLYDNQIDDESQRSRREQILRDEQRLKTKFEAAKEKEARDKERLAQRLKKDLKVLADAGREISECSSKVTELLQQCKQPELLPDKVNSSSSVMQQLEEKLAALQRHRQTSARTDMSVADALVDEARKVMDIVQRVVSEVNKLSVATALITSAYSSADTTQSPWSPSSPGATATVVTPSAGSQQVSASSSSTLLYSNVSDQCLETYSRLRTHLHSVEAASQPLLTDTNLKKYRNDLHKYINNTINAIAAASRQHIDDKLQRIVALLSGRTVEFANQRFSVNEHPAALPFCKNLFAKKIVEQGDVQVASKCEAAFCYAVVAVGVWCSFPDVGDLILAHFYQRCPYLVPYYMSKREDQTNEDFYRSSGYVVDGEVVEDQDKFLRRMTGFIRLYAAMQITPPPSRGANRRHPHGLSCAWSYLSSVLNLDPRPDITATMIFETIQITGSSLMQTYRSQFRKMLMMLIENFIPRVKRVTESADSGPITRLLNFLESILQTGSVPPPKGLISI